MQLYFLGTGAGVPSKPRNVTAIALDLLQEQGSWWLFDCGEGTQHQVLRAPLKLNRIERIFITHLHGDHIFGLPGVLSSRSFQGGTSDLTVYGPPGIQAYIETCLHISTTHLPYTIQVVEIDEDHLEAGCLAEDARFEVYVHKLDHGVPSYGYRIVEKPQPGALRPDAVAAFGIPPGPAYRELKSGRVVVAPDGRTVLPEEVTDPPAPGRVVTILGDTRPCEAAVKLAQDADVLVHEATFGEDKAQLAENYFHSTTVDAARCAVTAHAKRLILTHWSSRYADEELEDLAAEAGRLFPAVEIARDFTAFPVPQPTPDGRSCEGTPECPPARR